MIDLTNEQWRDVRYAIVEFKETFLWSVIVATLEKRRDGMLTDLDNPKTPENMTNYYRGGRFQLFRATMILDSLRKSADSALKKSRSDEDNDG